MATKKARKPKKLTLAQFNDRTRKKAFVAFADWYDSTFESSTEAPEGRVVSVFKLEAVALGRSTLEFHHDVDSDDVALDDEFPALGLRITIGPESL